MKIIIGLGNPGEKYRNTRHNTGFMVVDKISQNSKLKTQKEKILLVKPQRFMNESGIAVKKILQNNHSTIQPFNNLYVVHDDLDLPVGRIKIVKNRGAAGHKGVESIIKELGSKGFVRFRVGTGSNKYRELSIENREDYVLDEFKGEKKKLFEQSIERCTEAILYALENGIEKAMNKYNQI